MIRTWQFELAVVATVLAIVVIATGNSPTEWIGALGVTLTFAHAQVADRLAEREAQRERPEVECHAWAVRYFLGARTSCCTDRGRRSSASDCFSRTRCGADGGGRGDGFY